ncbi:hypothetical protein [Oceanirhabdus seepicola]|uniref:Uncharacterized protein n=1 Tax=Oceanirhabdus seepicola TaxID=2828781 RepID=A0A9J6NXS6_9CLOT|nr:hypothetical protein [Oceanirhabdus seepicola]MCM1988798.1 hypothetical protein [Oceanirhabdus seepicola]
MENNQLKFEKIFLSGENITNPSKSLEQFLKNIKSEELTSINIYRLNLEQMKVLFYSDIYKRYNEFGLKIKDIIESSLKKEIFFYEKDVDYLKSKNHNSIYKFKLMNMYKIQIDGLQPSDKVIFLFDNYNENIETVKKEIDNGYVVLPEVVSNIKVIRKNKILKLDIFICEKIECNEEAFHPDSCTEYIKELRLETSSSRILFYNWVKIFIKSNLKLNENNIIIYDDILRYKNLFHEDEIFYIREKIKENKANVEKESISRLENTLESLTSYSLDLSADIENLIKKKEYVKAIGRLYSEEKEERSKLKESLFLKLVQLYSRTVNDADERDLRLGIMCEEFICKYEIVPECIYDYIEEFYRKNTLRTDNTQKAIAIVERYYKDNIKAGRFILYNHIHNNFYNFEFFEILIKRYKRYGIKEKLVNRAINTLVRNKNTVITPQKDEFLEILLEVYKNNKDIYILEYILMFSKRANLSVDKQLFKDYIHHYEKYEMISLRSMQIAQHAFKIGVQGIEKYLLATLQYEYINREDADEYYSGINNNWTRLQGRFAKIGYSSKVKIRKNGEEREYIKNIISRNFIRKNFEILVDLYNTLKDIRAKEMIAETCIDNKMFYERILLDYIESNGSRKTEAYKLIIRNKIKNQIDEAFKYCLELYENVEASKFEKEFQDVLFWIRDEDLEKTIILVNMILSNSKIKHNLITRSFRSIIKSCAKYSVENNKTEKVAYIFQKLLEINEVYADNAEKRDTSEIILHYIKIIEDIKKEDYSLILDFYSKSEHKEEIIKILSLKNINVELAKLLIDMKILNENNILKIKVCGFVEKNIDYFVNEEYEEIIEDIISLKKSDKEKILEITSKVKLSDKAQNKILDIVEDQIDKDLNFVFKLLRNIEHYNNKAKSILQLNNDNKLIGRYEVESIEEFKLGEVRLTKDIFNNSEYALLEMDNPLSQLFKNSYESINKTALKSKQGCYIIKSYKKLTELIKDSDTIEKLNILKNLSVFLKNIFTFIKIKEDTSLEEIVILDDVPVPINILDSTIVREPYLLDTDLLNIIVSLGNKLFEDNKAVQKKLIEPIESKISYSVNEFIKQIEYLITSNNQEEKLSIGSFIDSYAILKESKDTVNQMCLEIVKKDISNDEAYYIVQENLQMLIDNQEDNSIKAKLLKYLIVNRINKNMEEEHYKQLLELENELHEQLVNDRQNYSVIKSFIKESTYIVRS